MAFADLLIEVCTVKRYDELGTDPYGNPTGTWDDHLEDEPCRISTPKGREIKIGAEVVIADYLLFLEDVDITEQDRVEMVVDGNTVTYEILLVARRKNGLGAHHRECYLRTVR